LAEKSFYNNKADVYLRALNAEDIELLKRHCNARRVALELEGLAASNLDFLLQCGQLEELVIYGGKVGDYSALGQLPKLKHIFMNGRLRRWQDSFEFLGDVVSLEKLQIMHYPLVSAFPNLEKCVKLESVEVRGCKRFEDISNMLRIPHLKSVLITGGLLTVEDVKPLAQKTGLLALNVSFRNKKENDEFMRLLKRCGLALWLE